MIAVVAPWPKGHARTHTVGSNDPMCRGGRLRAASFFSEGLSLRARPCGRGCLRLRVASLRPCANRALCMKCEGRQAARYADGRVSLCHVHLAEPRSPRYAGGRAIARAVVIVREVMTMADGHDCASHHEYGPFLPKPAGTFASPLALRGCLCRGAKAIVGLCRSSPASMLSCECIIYSLPKIRII